MEELLPVVDSGVNGFQRNQTSLNYTPSGGKWKIGEISLNSLVCSLLVSVNHLYAYQNGIYILQIIRSPNSDTFNFTYKPLIKGSDDFKAFGKINDNKIEIFIETSANFCISFLSGSSSLYYDFNFKFEKLDDIPLECLQATMIE